MRAELGRVLISKRIRYCSRVINGEGQPGVTHSYAGAVRSKRRTRIRRAFMLFAPVCERLSVCVCVCERRAKASAPSFFGGGGHGAGAFAACVSRPGPDLCNNNLGADPSSVRAENGLHSCDKAVSFRLFMSLNSDEQVAGMEDFMEDQPEAKDPDTEEPWDRESHVPRLYQITPETSDGQKELAKEEAEPQDCPSARQMALDIDRQAPGAGTYVPECAGNGDYARAQCHRSPPYCWCVHPRSGRPIRGTATQGVRPDCDAARAKHKNFKGCSLHKKQEFLDELIKSFSKEMLEDAANRSVSLDTPTAEKAARWKFAQTDANANGVLEKREWRTFRSERPSLEGRARRRLRKCWRNLPRFCDENADQKIALDEWLACTVTVRDSKSNLPRNPRRGKNPLTTILKSD